MRRSSANSIRRGAAMALALIVLLIVGMVSGLTLQSILRSHRLVREEIERVQAELLADSAYRRAVAMLRKDAAWKGEIWNVNLGDSEAEAAYAAAQGVATILVEKTAEEERLRVTVSVIVPNDPIQRAQAEREFTYTVPGLGGSR